MLAASICGCGGLVDSAGKSVSLRQYDSVIVDEVRIAPSVSQAQTGELLKGHLQAHLLADEHWTRGEEFDVEGFAKVVERYATTPGTVNGKPVEPAMTQQEFLDKYAAKKQRSLSLQSKPKGSRPLTLKVEITEFDFPGSVDAVVTGRSAKAKCKLAVYDTANGRLIGTADVVVRNSLPGVPLTPAAMAIRGVKGLIVGAYTRKHVLSLVDKLSRESVRILNEAKKR